MKQITFTLIFSIIVLSSLWGTTYTSIADGSWNNPATWSPAGIPNVSSWPGDEVTITHNITYSGNLTLNHGTVLTIENGGQLQTTGKVTVSSGFNGHLWLKSGAGLVCTDFSSNSVGTVDLDGLLNCNKFIIKSAGIVNSDGLNLTANEVTVDNSGQFFADNTTISTGKLTAKGAARLTFTNGELNTSSNVLIDNSAVVSLAGMSVSVGGNLTLRGAGKLQLDGGSLNVSGNTKLDNSGRMEVDGDGTVTLSSASLKGAGAIAGVGTGGILGFSSISITQGASITCVSGNCSFTSGMTPPNPLDLFSGNQALPVELESFLADKREKSIVLTWVTASEENNLGFAVERSIDGVVWEEITFVKGAGTSSERNIYVYTDLPVESKVYYYRLAQMDVDGKVNFSPVRSVRFSSTSGTIEVFPNPTVDYFKISSNNLIEDVKLVASDGSIIANYPIAPSSQATFYLPENMAAGIYVVRVKTANGNSMSLNLLHLGGQ